MKRITIDFPQDTFDKVMDVLSTGSGVKIEGKNNQLGYLKFYLMRHLIDLVKSKEVLKNG